MFSKFLLVIGKPVASSFNKYRLDTLNQSLNGLNQVRKRRENDRRASHFSEIDVAEELENSEAPDRWIFVARVVKNVIQNFDNLFERHEPIRHRKCVYNDAGLKFAYCLGF